jgi:hypothetical protein
MCENKFFTDILIQDFKNCCQHWSKRWGYYEESEWDYLKKNLDCEYLQLLKY